MMSPSRAQSVGNSYISDDKTRLIVCAESAIYPSSKECVYQNDLPLLSRIYFSQRDPFENLSSQLHRLPPNSPVISKRNLEDALKIIKSTRWSTNQKISFKEFFWSVSEGAKHNPSYNMVPEIDNIVQKLSASINSVQFVKQVGRIDVTAGKTSLRLEQFVSNDKNRNIKYTLNLKSEHQFSFDDTALLNQETQIIALLESLEKDGLLDVSPTMLLESNTDLKSFTVFITASLAGPRKNDTPTDKGQADAYMLKALERLKLESLPPPRSKEVRRDVK